MMKMVPINIIFYLAIFTNGKVLQYSTVETFIAFRSLTPILVSLLDTTVRGEPAPSIRTMLSLVAIAAGAGLYARDDDNYNALGYAWALGYLVIITLEMVYAKHITGTIGLSTWGLVLYQNVIALTLAPVAAVATGELSQMVNAVAELDQRSLLRGHQRHLTSFQSIQPDFLLPLTLSCGLAVGISFAGWGARSAITATQFTVLGVACKLATVAINLLVWDHHAPGLAQLSIILCIFASVLYQQSAKIDKEKAPPQKM